MVKWSPPCTVAELARTAYQLRRREVLTWAAVVGGMGDPEAPSKLLADADCGPPAAHRLCWPGDAAHR